jgi:S-adenosylmethionine/arginine decarboxylase-like enzyme
MSEKFVPNHLHFIMRAEVQDPIRSVHECNEWLRDLVEIAGMKVVAGPTSVYVSEPGNEGVTGTITLATSHASIHVWDTDHPSLVQFDIYSCKEFSVKDVVEHFEKMKVSSYSWILIDRNDGLKQIASGQKFAT